MDEKAVEGTYLYGLCNIPGSGMRIGGPILKLEFDKDTRTYCVTIESRGNAIMVGGIGTGDFDIFQR